MSFALTGNERWFVVRSHPRQEIKAELNLKRQGYRIFLPRMPGTVRHARQTRNVLVPVFPGYLFVVLDPDRDRWRSINNTLGVASMIMTLERPQPVPSGVVEDLREKIAAGFFPQSRQVLREGDPVRLISGPFANAIGCLDRLDANGRVKVLLEIMGGKISAFANQSAVEPA